MAVQNSLTLRLNIPAERYLAFYRDPGRVVFAEAVDGRTVQFPAHVLRRYVTREGIHGLFELTFDEAQRFVGIQRIGN